MKYGIPIVCTESGQVTVAQLEAAIAILRRRQRQDGGSLVEFRFHPRVVHADGTASEPFVNMEVEC